MRDPIKYLYAILDLESSIAEKTAYKEFKYYIDDYIMLDKYRLLDDHIYNWQKYLPYFHTILNNIYEQNRIPPFDTLRKNYMEALYPCIDNV